MSSLTQARTNASEILARVKISEVYHALTGTQPRRVGEDAWRGPAVWRGGDGLNVSLNGARGLWHDFATGEGGGVLDLVVRVRGGSRPDALRWVADFAGMPLDDRPLSPAERDRWAKQQRLIETELSNARLWRRAAVVLGELVLDNLKAALGDATLPRPEIGEIAFWTARVMAWRRLDGAELVAEFLRWARRSPCLTAGMVYAARLRETAERRAILRYLGLKQQEAL
jgi:hypothetical protein